MLSHEMIQERSAGAVIFRLDGGRVLYLILNYPTGHWDFPKGNVEKGEDTLATVKREVTEETSINDIAIIPGFKKVIEYYYRRNSNLIYKQVIYLLAKSETPDVKLSYEHKGYAWLEFKEALKKVTYNNAKNVLKEADRFLTAKPTHLEEFVP